MAKKKHRGSIALPLEALDAVEVRGSTPLAPTIFFQYFRRFDFSTIYQLLSALCEAGAGGNTPRRKARKTSLKKALSGMGGSGIIEPGDRPAPPGDPYGTPVAAQCEGNHRGTEMEREEWLSGFDVTVRYGISRRTLIEWVNAGLPATDPVRRERILIYRGSLHELKKPDASPFLVERGYPPPFSKSPSTLRYEEYVEAVGRGIDLLLFRVSDIEAFKREHGLPSLSETRDAAARRTGEETRKGPRPDQRHRRACRRVAGELWAKDPTITIAEMAGRDEINILFDGKVYRDSTIRRWIKELCPNRSPGRRKKS